MKVTVLTDNVGACGLDGEWGLSLLVECGGVRFLLDTGATGLFLRNAEKLGMDIGGVDFAVISHAHYDHAGGIAAFMAANDRAPVYLSPNAGENCYSGPGRLKRYIGMPKGAVRTFGERILRPEGVTEISPGVTIVPHTTGGLAALGRRNHLYVRKGLMYRPDDFSHELSVAVRTSSGLAVMNSCSHSGPDVVIAEVQKAFPGERIAAYIGGLHLFRLTDDEVAAVAERLEGCGIDRIFTGHCTGQRAFDILRERLGGRVQQFRCGAVIDIL